jgi:Resolvase, N terminal domain
MIFRDTGVVDRGGGSVEAIPSSKTFGLRSTSQIRNRHLDRLAIVYVRQSTPQQVLENLGIVLGLELSSLSRSNAEWHRLIDVCGLFQTLLCDQDGVYDALDSNDRLLLGMKSAMSEYELITMRNRLLRGSRNKAERGELFLAVPLGYHKTPTGEVIQSRTNSRGG